MLTARRLTVLVGMVVIASACGTSSSPTSAAGTAATPTAPPAATQPPPTPAPTAAPPNGAGAASAVAAVQALIANPAAGATICRPSSGPRFSGAAGCPVSQRLEQRLQSNPTGGSAGGADPVCRCQNFNIPPPVTLVGQAGASATVKVAFGFPGHPNDVQFTVVTLGGRWYVDDSYCADLSTSIYQSPVRTCAA